MMTKEEMEMIREGLSQVKAVLRDENTKKMIKEVISCYGEVIKEALPLIKELYNEPGFKELFELQAQAIAKHVHTPVKEESEVKFEVV